MSASLAIDGQLDDWVCQASWVPGAAARAPWVPFGDFYLAWRRNGLYIATVYQEDWGGAGDGTQLMDRQRLLVAFADGTRQPVGVALVGFAERVGPPPPEKAPDNRPSARIRPGAALGKKTLNAFDGIWGSQSDRSLLRTAEVFIPARMFGKEELAQGDILLLGMSLLLKGDTKETFWPSSQTMTAPDTARLARLRLGNVIQR